MCEQLSLPICLNANATVSDFHVRLSALVESEEVSQIHEALYSLKSCGSLKSESLKYFSQKMLLDFLTMRGGGVTFGIIISTMAELGYSCEWQVLNSKDFGVPQHRQRVFIIGHLGGIGGRTVFPITENCETADELQGFGNRNRVVSTPLKVGGSMNTNGIYIADRQTDRQTDRQIFLKVNGFHK